MALLLILFFLMLIIGGKSGLNSFLSILLNTCLLILVALLISWGINIEILLLIFIPLKLATIIFLGTHDVRVAKISFYAAFLVSLILAVIIIVLEYFAQAAGFGEEAGEELVGLSQFAGISYPVIAVAVAIFSTLGAISEASVAMSSGLIEIKKHNPKITSKQLEHSASKIGVDVLTTAVNTILFSLFASFLPLFIWYLRLNYSLGQILNEKLFVSEMLIMIYAIIGVVLTIPLTSWLLARKMGQKEKSVQ
ncbi:hypothetical protein FC23_GL001264 [Lactobacillus psittaci DSM 15354]|uniref:Multitransmembrane protein n=2 Tax=Lactobacillus psittaci TaxID=116089 RepID=A0A0R1S2C5_9LACO|nr:hypothetical protein FC23_GL001264 [Lactobacillus psittaci DSM 15354]